MKDLIIVGAGGFGCEAISIAESINKKKKEWNILGFLDDNKEIGFEMFHGYRVIRNIKGWEPKPYDFFFMCFFSSNKKIYNTLKNQSGQFSTLISPSVFIPENRYWRRMHDNTCLHNLRYIRSI